MSRTRSTGGSRSSGSKQAKERQKALQQLSKGLGKGLSALDVTSSSDSDSNAADSGFSEESGDDGYGYIADDGVERHREWKSQSSRGLSSVGSARKRKEASYAFEMPSAPPPRRQSGSSTRKAPKLDRTYVSDPESSDDDMDNFILNEEEEAEEEEARQEAAAKAYRKEKKGTQKAEGREEIAKGCNWMGQQAGQEAEGRGARPGEKKEERNRARGGGGGG